MLTWVPTWRELHVQFSSDITFFFEKKKKNYIKVIVFINELVGERMQLKKIELTPVRSWLEW